MGFNSACKGLNNSRLMQESKLTHIYTGCL